MKLKHDLQAYKTKWGFRSAKREGGLKYLIFLIFFIQLIMAPIDYFWVEDRNAFPFFSWELGFGKAYIEAPQALIYIKSINNRSLPDKTTIRSMSSRFLWRKRQDIKFVSSMIRKLKSGDLEGFKLKQKNFENKFFEKNKYEEITYEVVDRIKNMKTGEARETIYGPYVFKRR